MPRPDLCPNCGASCTAHTGAYCEECGEVLVRPEAPRTRTPIEVCEAIIDESLRNLKRMETGEHEVSYLGAQYDKGYSQGRKDACRAILRTLDPTYKFKTSEDV